MCAFVYVYDTIFLIAQLLFVFAVECFHSNIMICMDLANIAGAIGFSALYALKVHFRNVNENIKNRKYGNHCALLPHHHYLSQNITNFKNGHTHTHAQVEQM